MYPRKEIVERWNSLLSLYKTTDSPRGAEEPVEHG
jgi:hypothetical protein